MLGCFLPGENGLFFRQMVTWGLFLFGWACFFMLLAFHRTLAEPQQSVGLCTGTLTGNWAYMLNVSFIASGIMHMAANFSPNFLGT